MNVMIMDLQGPSLAHIFSKSNCQFDLETVLNIGIQAVEILKDVHAEGIIYRDVKPENMLIGLSKN